MELEPFIFRHEGQVLAQRAREADEQEELAGAVNRFALRPLERAEYAVFTLDLCHNQIDRHHSRFPDEELEAISRMVVGRPLMERHDLHGSLPRGTFFRSSVHGEARRKSVRPDVYVLQTPENASFILNIEGGVYRETSIGFSFKTPECSICTKDLRACDHVPGRQYGDATCHYVMREVLEVIEGSVVPAGSQGTQFVAARHMAMVPGQPLPLNLALEIARDQFHRPIELRPSRLWAAE
ncbi:MAG: hypothetical protein KJ052_03200 [Candidatus Hydrogenedentes bacterium]|nr:hypothetical protein [Candidatus Hydrogenedentota bacterium]